MCGGGADFEGWDDEEGMRTDGAEEQRWECVCACACVCVWRVGFMVKRV